MFARDKLRYRQGRNARGTIIIFNVLTPFGRRFQHYQVLVSSYFLGVGEGKSLDSVALVENGERRLSCFGFAMICLLNSRYFSCQ